jgi:hypothetical protein
MVPAEEEIITPVVEEKAGIIKSISNEDNTKKYLPWFGFDLLWMR